MYYSIPYIFRKRNYNSEMPPISLRLGSDLILHEVDEFLLKRPSGSPNSCPLWCYLTFDTVREL